MYAIESKALTKKFNSLVYDWMKPEEFLIFTGELFSIDKMVLNKRIENILELVGLSGVKKKIGSFSRGMKQRLGIAQALINEPKVVFLDEPTSALDPIGRKEVMDVILKLSGSTIIPYINKYSPGIFGSLGLDILSGKKLPITAVAPLITTIAASVAFIIGSIYIFKRQEI